VNVEETVSQVVTVDGQVEQPGLYPVVGRMTLMRAIATAKGTSEFARLQDVVVFRRVGSQEMAALYNLGAIRQGSYPDPEIFAHDIIVVGDSPTRRRFRDILQASPLFLTPLVALIQRF
jgi:polysaccharide export outer membrane protein